MTQQKNEEVIELVVYEIKPELEEQYVTDSIERFRQLVISLDGFIEYELHKSCFSKGVFMDLVRWRSLEQAIRATQKVKALQHTQDYEEYLAAFNSLEIFEHFRLLKKRG